MKTRLFNHLWDCNDSFKRIILDLMSEYMGDRKVEEARGKKLLREKEIIKG